MVFDGKLNVYRPSLLPFKSQSSGLIFLGEDKYSKEYRVSVRDKKKNFSLQMIDLGNIAPATKTEIAIIDPYQIKEFIAKQYAIVHIGLQRYTLGKARTNIPFIPDFRWLDDISDDRMDVQIFKDQYRNRMRSMQDLFPNHWRLTLERPRLAICNYRDVYDYDYSMDFVQELAIFLERHWMDANITNAQNQGVHNGW